MTTERTLGLGGDEQLAANEPNLSPTPAPDTGEAVAWRWRSRFSRHGHWTVASYPIERSGYECEPLYASNNLEEVERLREALEDVLPLASASMAMGSTPAEWDDIQGVLDRARETLRASQALGGKRDV